MPPPKATNQMADLKQKCSNRGRDQQEAAEVFVVEEGDESGMSQGTNIVEARHHDMLPG